MALDFVPKVGDVVVDYQGKLIDIISTTNSWDYPIKGRIRGDSYDSVWTENGWYYQYTTSERDIVKLYKREIKEDESRLDSRDYFIKVMGGIL